MLLGEARQTHLANTKSLRAAQVNPNFRVMEQEEIHGIDAFVQQAIAATNGLMYRSIIGKLTEYPIPKLILPKGDGDCFLDIGCNWGRWSIAAAKLGYKAVGIDPSLDAICAAYRVARKLGVEAYYLVGDARFLPFADQSLDLVFSYSVFQHFNKTDAKSSLKEIRRILKDGGKSLIQMPNAFGPRSLYNQMRRGFRTAKDFEVRYWTLPELKETFSTFIGPSQLSVDGYFSLNPQSSEAHLLPWRYRAVVKVSDRIRRLSNKLKVLTYFADSVYVSSLKFR